MIAYHDNEWGKVHKDERDIFELLSLEIMQAGLKWELILKRRQAIKRAFDNFEIAKVALFTDAKIETLMQNSQIIRNRRKILAITNNARVLLQLQKNGFIFSKYLWHFTEGRPINNNWQFSEQVPAKTPLSAKIALDLKKMGFNFVGPTIIYSFLQATGVVNDHIETCSFK
ncbi:DNA-3-methyladenine glycosylase I [Liquorilactobacillus oeni DSM 19972]|uniref:DNA-3-methyladenine glycosylase I n=1 Tax=Liquorilactobacillus oeni DSM 19972 TaxID=1423777 RepID=A0A0R1MGL5_9LACO|nr:DNA-3-methyladenine glycosylase I [Liquorilactobacillus oeni DSM 19972]